jgi:hypothetical protein
MLFESTKILLRSLVQSLEDGDEARWDDRLESGKQCLYELHQMSRCSPNRTYATRTPFSETAARTIPHVKLMMGGIRRRDQASALQGGRAAMVEIDSAGSPRSVNGGAEPRMVRRSIPAVPILVPQPVIREPEKPKAIRPARVETRVAPVRRRAAKPTKVAKVAKAAAAR